MSPSTPTFLQPLLSRDRETRLVNATNGQLLARDVSAAVDSASRRQGLLGLAAMPEGSALVIAPSNAIHTFFMRFAIDVAFVARDGTVVAVRHGLAPWRLAAAWRGYAVIELPAGVLARSMTRPGDRLHLTSS